MKIVKSFTVRDGKFTFYSSGPMWNPAETVIIDNIKADKTFRNLVEETDEQGRFKSYSGEVGG